MRKAAMPAARKKLSRAEIEAAELQKAEDARMKESALADKLLGEAESERRWKGIFAGMGNVFKAVAFGMAALYAYTYTRELSEAEAEDAFSMQKWQEELGPGFEKAGNSLASIVKAFAGVVKPLLPTGGAPAAEVDFEIE